MQVIPEWIEAVLHTIESWTCWLLFTFVNIYYMSSLLDSKFLSFSPHSIAVLVKSCKETDYCINGCDTLYWTVYLTIYIRKQSTTLYVQWKSNFSQNCTSHKSKMNVIYTTVVFFVFCIRLYSLLFMYLFLSLIPFCFLFMWRLVFYVIVIYKIFFLYTS